MSETPSTPAIPAAGSAGGPVSRRRWIVFSALAVAVVIADQATKLWVDAGFARASASGQVPGLAAPTPILGDFLRIAKSYNSGGPFGLFNAAAPLLALASVVVIALLVYAHARSGTGESAAMAMLTTIAFGLLLGGALGNLVDRIRIGAVIDWVDMGIGDTRWYTFNVADASLSVAIAALIVMAVLPARPGRAGAGR